MKIKHGHKDGVVFHEMDIEEKTLPFEIKELTEEGVFSGYLSTFGNVDYGGDIVDPGAFKKTLKENKTFPLAWQHQYGTPDLIVGSFEASEDSKGLFITGGFFIDQDGGLKAYKLVKKFFDVGIKVGLSMGYRTLKDAYEKVAGGFVRHLKEVRLREGSITLFPMDKRAAVTQLKEESGLHQPGSDTEPICAICKKTLKTEEPDRLGDLLKELKGSTPEDKPSSEDSAKRLTKILMEV